MPRRPVPEPDEELAYGQVRVISYRMALFLLAPSSLDTWTVMVLSSDDLLTPWPFSGVIQTHTAALLRDLALDEP